ncbi:CHAT domain-containing protein [Luedemannella helvata]|uniref:CHAT domain-containing protein n=1 Tax=Luedemannella helvata TaxID=349315 RepID=A0ABP4W064_9ACTN
MSTFHTNIERADNVQVGDHNSQFNYSGAEPAHPRGVILAVFANPFGTDGLRLDEESRAILRAVRAGDYRDHLDVVQVPAARYDEVGPNLQRHRPVVVHVGTHGTETGSLVFADGNGRPLDVPARALADLFASHSATIRCVVLNGCFTRPLAEAIAANGPCVVGTSRAIADALAIEFAGAFHTAVANGRSFDEAFTDARIQLDLGDRAGADALVLVGSPASRCRTAVT